MLQDSLCLTYLTDRAAKRNQGYNFLLYILEMGVAREIRLHNEELCSDFKYHLRKDETVRSYKKRHFRNHS